MDTKLPQKNFTDNAGISRRKFLGSSAALVGGAMLSPLSVRASAHAAGSDKLKIALVGCGARGIGAVRDALLADEATELVAMADVFKDILDRNYRNLMEFEPIKDRINVPDEHKFVGLDAYKYAIELADVVLLVTPPAFRPLHFETAVNAGKHVFLEKPLSSDAPGTRRIMAAGKLAEEKGLSVMVGLQNRYSIRQNRFKEKMDAGIIGDLTSMSCNYMINGISQIERQPGWSEMEYQLRNWRHFEWLWAGSVPGLTIHFEDVVHWVKGSHPVKAFGTGGRAGLEGPEYGDIYDNYYIEYEYADGTRFHSRTRHIKGCWVDRSMTFQGTEGHADVKAWRDSEIKNRKGDTLWSYADTDDQSPYLIEHEVFFKAIRSGKVMNDTEWAGLSNMTSIMGRMAVQSGRLVEWDDVYNSDLVLVPDDLTFNSEPPASPDENGNYHVIVPGNDNERVI